MVPRPANRSSEPDDVSDENASPVILLVEPQVFASNSIANAMQLELERYVVLQTSDGVSVNADTWDNVKLLVITSSALATTGENSCLFERLRDRDCKIPVVFLGDPVEPESLELLSKFKLVGIFPATSQTNTVMAGLKFILEGGKYLPIEFNMLNWIPPVQSADQSLVEGDTSTFEDGLGLPDGGLTNREKAVLGWLAQGQSNKVIASRLGIAQNTTKIHVRGILRKLNVTNRTQAVLTAQRLNLIDTL